jgi:RimJ/RimL family protein N-acetyltransferase
MPSSEASRRSVAEVIAETARLIIRPWRDEDRDDYLATCNSEAVTAHLGGPASAAEIDAAIGRIRQAQNDKGFCYWAVSRRSDGAFLGYCGLKPTDLTDSPVQDEIEIGWRFREDAWGRGYALEAASRVIEWAWANTSAGRIVSFTVPANRASWTLMERLGMARRPDLDFAHPKFSADHPLSRHITYVMERPSS